MKVKQNSWTLVVSFIQFVLRTDMLKSSSKVFGTLILTISLISLQGTSSHLQQGIGNIRKLLEADSDENQQQVSRSRAALTVKPIFAQFQ